MQDVEQDGDIWGNPLPGQVSDDQDQQDCAEELMLSNCGVGKDS